MNTADIKNKLLHMRFMTHQGNVISFHHSLYKVKFTLGILLSMVVIPLFFNLLQVYLSDSIMVLWGYIIEFFLDKLHLPGILLWQKVEIFIYKTTIPYPSLAARMPTFLDLLLGSCIVLVLCFLGSLLSQAYLPVAYIIYLSCFILFTSIIFFAYILVFPFNLGESIRGNFDLCLKLLLIIPWILGFTFNVFHFSLFRKLLLPALTLGYFCVLYPFQYLFFALIVHKFSLLYLPSLHFMLTMFFNVMLFVALYAWAMSWEDKKIANAVNLKDSSKKMLEL
jgi:hypothetical protein